MNKAEDFMRLAVDMDNRTPWIKRRCPWCHAFALFLKYGNYTYECKACEREGDISEVKHKYYGDMMTERSGVKL